MGGCIHSWAVMFVREWSHSFMGGHVRVHLWMVMPLARCGGEWAIGGWCWWWLVLMAIHSVVVCWQGGVVGPCKRI